MQLIALGASTSSTSINRQFAIWAARQVPGAAVTALDLRDFPVPLFSTDAEEADGYPDAARAFLEQIAAHDGVVLSLAEHNGAYTAAFKNLFDWASRIERAVWAEKPMLLLSTSPGGRGGASVIEAGAARFPHLGANIVAQFSLPSFYDTFSEADGIRDEALAKSFAAAVEQFAAVF